MTGAPRPPEPSDNFRAVMRRFPTGVAIVTTVHEGQPRGFTLNAFTSVSADPPTILICVNRKARSHPLISAAGFFCVNVLALEQKALAIRFAARDRVTPFEGVPYHIERTGAAVIDDSLAFLDCELAEEHSAATHTIFLGRALACGFRDGSPLGYLNAGYRDFGCRLP